jgi:hypothetical protein
VTELVTQTVELLDTLEITTLHMELVEVGTQGPPGPAGPVGPPGPPNTTPISAAPGNTLTLGPDNGLFVQQVWSGTPAW